MSKSPALYAAIPAARWRSASAEIFSAGSATSLFCSSAFSTALTYKMTREWWLRTEYRREWLDSTVNSADYAANIFLVGLRLQR